MTVMTRTVVAIVQARMGSTRLPGKVMARLHDRLVVDHVVGRLQRAQLIDRIVVAIPVGALDDPLAAHLEGRGVAVARGPEDDVLTRFAIASRGTSATHLVRITADCPLLDPTLVDAVVGRLLVGDVDYVSNVEPRHFPDGLDVEAMTIEAFEKADREASDAFSRMHVTPFVHGRRANLRSGGFRKAAVVAPANFAHLRWTLDEPEDLELLERVFALIEPDASWLDVVALLTSKPELLSINGHISANQGAVVDERRLTGLRPSFDRSNQMFARALDTIPLASQTFSKSHYQWPRGAAPLFLDRSKGGHTWDIDGNRYVDYVLGLLPIVLGHGDPDVDEAVRRQLARGVTFSLPTLLEAEVAERIVRHVPCAEKVRFGKNGSDATTAAVRLARAFTGRARIAVAGYHGWHDWYIGSTTRDLGVPVAVKGLTSTFRYNDADSLAALLDAHPDGYAAIVLEPASTTAPAPGFLERVRELADRTGTVLVFDEIITGFRIGLSGAQGYYGVTPDLASFGKAIANGLPLAAIAGRADIMAKMDDVFISGTFGGEALSLAAAAATIDKLEREDVPRRLWALGDELVLEFNEIAARHGFGGMVSMSGEGWWPRLTTQSLPVPAPLFTSLWRQMLARHGLLLGASFNLCLAHEAMPVRDQTRNGLDLAFAALRDALDAKDPARALDGELVRAVFSVR
jgi:glutamate-1-semialdehyde 2,1-aminomutase